MIDKLMKHNDLQVANMKQTQLILKYVQAHNKM
jgi:hypothetical protein